MKLNQTTNNNTPKTDADTDVWKLPIMKILLPMLIVLGIIMLVKYGYATGQWLYSLLH